MSLSKLYTAKIVADIIRGVVKELGEGELQPEEVLSYINIAQQTVYNASDDYYKEDTLTESSNIADFSSKSVGKPIKLVDSLSGIVWDAMKPLSVLEYDELANAPSKQFKVYATKIGEKFKLYKGEEVNAYGTLTLTFIKRLTPCITEADFLDVNDQDVPKVIDIATSLVSKQLGQKAE